MTPLHERASARDRIAIMGAASDHYARHLTVAMHSALSHIDPAREVYVLAIDGGMTPQSAARLTACLEAAHPRARVEVRAPDPARLAGLPISARYPAAVYMPLLGVGLLPPGIDRALCLDADVVATEDVTPLLDMDLGGRALWAGRDSPADTHVERLRASFPEADIPPLAAYVNTGVMLIDVAAWRRERVSQRALDLLRSRPEACIWTNQDAVNVVLGGRIGLLDNRWNNRLRGHDHVFPDLAGRRGPEGILHYCGPKKPWRGWCVREGAYHQALLASGWLTPGETAAYVAQLPFRQARLAWHLGRRRLALGTRLRQALEAAAPKAPA